jgi:carbamoyltransferase
MKIVGLGGLLNDPACIVLKEGKLSAAVEQKKVARRWRAGELPQEALDSALDLARLTPEQVDIVALARPLSEQGDSTLHVDLRDLFPSARVVVVEHHLAHAASAFYVSGFDEATVLTLDRSGDFRCGARWSGSGAVLTMEQESYFPDSLGDLYGRVTQLLGFEARADEHKVQWLAPAGTPDLAGLFSDLLPARKSDWPRPDRSYFDADRQGRGGFGSKFYERLGLADGADIPAVQKPRLAAGLQRAVEQAVLSMAGTGENLCLAGGLFMNALLVASLERSGAWKNVFVQPAAGNAGTALGAALWAWHNLESSKPRIGFPSLALGPAFKPEEIKQVLENCKLRFRFLQTTDDLIAQAVEQLSGNLIVAWMQGRMEFGPRALGNRSILASPLDPFSTENLNIFIKHREPFRKFAASVPEELAAHYFDAGPNARFLATVSRVRPEHRKKFEHAVFGEDLLRVHTVTREENPLFHRLLLAWGEKTGLPVLYNTSFNLFGDPLVCTPRDAVRSFFSSGIDAMFVGHFLLEK